MVKIKCDVCMSTLPLVLNIAQGGMYIIMMGRVTHLHCMYCKGCGQVFNQYRHEHLVVCRIYGLFYVHCVAPS